MKEKLYTIPVNDAFDQAGECPFCALAKKLEAEILDYILGPSYMEEDVRAETDRLGFCKDHYRQMFQAGNRLGLALMLHTHIKKLNREMGPLLEQEKAATEQRRLARRKEQPGAFVQYGKRLDDSCYACQRMEQRMNSYLDTFFHLFRTEPEFREKIKNGQGFCLEHFTRALEEGQKRLDSRRYRELLDLLIPLETENFRRIEDELEWFIRKFDYRYQKEPWKNSRDAVERAVLKVAAVRVGEPGTRQTKEEA